LGGGKKKEKGEKPALREAPSIPGKGTAGWNPGLKSHPRQGNFEKKGRKKGTEGEKGSTWGGRARREKKRKTSTESVKN